MEKPYGERAEENLKRKAFDFALAYKTDGWGTAACINAFNRFMRSVLHHPDWEHGKDWDLPVVDWKAHFAVDMKKVEENLQRSKALRERLEGHYIDDED